MTTCASYSLEPGELSDQGPQTPVLGPHVWGGTQLTGVPDIHRPATQLSTPLQSMASRQVEPLGKGGNEQAPLAGLHVFAVQALPSSQTTGTPAAEHTPIVHTSAPSQRSVSAQDVPFCTFSCKHPQPASHLAVVHRFPSSGQVSGVPGRVHRPAKHLSVPLHKFPSAQLDPSAAFPGTQMPVSGTQVFAVQALPSLSDAHTTAAPAVQAPFEQTCPSQRLPSGHAVPLARVVNEQAPVRGLQASMVQGLPSLQVRARPLEHTPKTHDSAPLHRLPSEHGIPSTSVRFEHPSPGLQLSVVQELLSLQRSGVPAMQMPFEQVSVPLQGSASEHDPPVGMGADVQAPVAGTQASTVQGLPSSAHTDGVPAVHTPLLQVCPSQRSASRHGVPIATGSETHAPVFGAHVSKVHGSPSLQPNGAPALQRPPTQVAIPLQRFVSTQSSARAQGRPSTLASTDPASPPVIPPKDEETPSTRPPLPV